MKNFTKWFNLKKTPQSEPIPGTSQVANSNAGFVWAVDDWARLDRFLILGSEGGTFYATEQQAHARERRGGPALHRRGRPRASSSRIVEISDAGRAPKNDPALFALALAAKLGDERHASRRVRRRCRGSRASERTSSTSPSTSRRSAAGDAARCGRSRAGTTTWRRAVSRSRPSSTRAATAGRTGTSCARRTRSRRATQHQAIYHWMVKGWDGVGETPHPDRVLATIWAFERAKRLQDPRGRRRRCRR